MSGVAVGRGAPQTFLLSDSEKSSQHKKEGEYPQSEGVVSVGSSLRVVRFSLSLIITYLLLATDQPNEEGCVD